MKKLSILLLSCLIISASIYAQPPQAFKYQAVVRNTAGDILQNQAVGIRISIHDATATGTIIYQETFSETTNQFGLVNLEIGNGAASIGAFAGIDWGSSPKFMETEIDPVGGTSYISMGTSELLSVPYALYAETSGGTSAWGKNGDTLYYVTGNVGIGTASPQGEFHVNNPAEWDGVTFNGTGLNDLNVDYAGYNGTGETSYFAEVTNAGPNPNIFKWSNDNGATWTENVQMAISGIDVGNGVSIGFDALDGHTFGDQWTWTVSESFMDGFIVKNGKVGIGTENPGAKLDVSGHIWQTGTGNSVFIGEGAGESDDLSDNKNVFIGNESGYSNTTGYINSFLGFQSGYSNTEGYSNVFIGNESGYSNTTGYINSFLGFQSGYSNTEGYSNVFIGYESGYNNTDGAANTFIGNESGYSNTTGMVNTFIGDRCGYANTEGEKNTSLGYKSAFLNTTGSENVSLGYKALYYNTGDKNTATGFAALYKNASGYYNTASGSNSLYFNTTGNLNTANGTFSLYSNTTGNYNTANGASALYYNTTGGYNTANGTSALYYNTTGGYNTANGVGALYYNTTGNYNTANGHNAYFTYNNIYNTTCLGYNSGAISNVSNRIEMGNSSVSWIGGQVTWSTYSDRRIKTDIKENVAGLDFIKNLRPVTYNLDIHKQNEMIKRDGKGKEEGDWPGKYDIENLEMTGFIAQEVEEAAKSAGYSFSGVRKAKDDLGMYSISYAQFVVPLVKGMQEQQAIIEKQQSVIEELQLRIEKLEQTNKQTNKP